jgi:hypothetical protein
MTRKMWLTAALLFGLLAGGGSLRAEEYFDYDDAGGPECSDGTGAECFSGSYEQCLEYQIVEVQIGSQVKFERVCSHKVTHKTFRYWK